MTDRRPNGWAGLARFGGVGDNLIAAVALPGLKKKYGRVEVVTSNPQGIVFEGNPSIDKLSITDKDTIPISPPEAWQGWFNKRAVEYDFFIHLSHSCETLRALLPTQTQFWWPAEWRRKFCDHNYLETVLDICGLPHEFGPLFFPTVEEKVQAFETKQKVGSPCIGWVISGTRIDKAYPHSPTVIAKLIREVAPVVMLGAPLPSQNFHMAQGIQADVQRANGSDAGLHLALSPNAERPTWPIRRVLAFAQVCDIVISPDTGPAWATAFEPNAKVMLLSHASVENITKHWVNTVSLHADDTVPCWPCHQLHSTGETCTPNPEKTAAACISSISPDTIVAHVKRILNDGERRLICGKSGAELPAQRADRDTPGAVGNRLRAGGAE